MPLSPYQRIGAYTVVSSLGAGGMGEVYRARDTKLDRDVAIKILPESFASDPDRVMRFEREAKTLASLNHPHIAQIHGFESDNSPAEAGRPSSFLVMELVDGEDLSQRIARGAIPIDEALPIAKQIAEALEAAHEAGIVHRDLKPANVKVRDDGTVKVLDFGLAKGIEPGTGSREPGAGLANSPTITSPAMTQAGIILGTAAYMSPEQAKGKFVNRRTDMWAFGCVLFEMLTGARAFGGEDVTDTLAKIVMGEPQWSLLPASTSPTIQRLLRRCLEKDARRRLDSASVARLEIESASSPEAPAATPAIAASSTRRWAWAGWITAGLSSAAVVLLIGWPRAPEAPSVSLEVPTPGLSFGTGQTFFAVSPDGSRVAMRTIENDEPVLSVRRLDQFDSTTLRATTSAAWPFWSPDNRSIAYFVNSRLQVSPVDGGPPQSVPGVTTSVNLTQGAWNAEGVILYSSVEQGIMRTSITGATPVAVTSIDKAKGEDSHLYPRFLPGGMHFLYLAATTTQTPSIFVGSLDGTPAKRLLSANAHAEFVSPDHLLYVRDGTLMAQRFDVKRLAIVGEPSPLINEIYTNTANSLAGFSISQTGVLVYRPSRGAGRQLQWVDRSGNVLSKVGSTADFRNVNLSPDGRVMAVHRPDNGGDVWLTDLERGTDTRFTVDPAMDDNPVWTPDGKRIAFVSNRDGGIFNIYLKSAGGVGAEELLLKTAGHKRLGGWTPDGAYLLYDEVGDKTNRDIWMMPMAGDRQPIKVIGGPFNEDEPSVSPDGRWLAYSSDESGTYQIYVQAFPKGDRKWRVSSASTTVRHPRWTRDGKELFYDVTGRMAVARITTGADGIVAGAEQRLFFGLLNLPPHNYALSPDGNRILAILSPLGAGADAPPLRIVTNWTRLLPK